ncbi:tetratricopeptide repeat protein [Gemelliphila palaticanis]|uniref:Uncharacterized protein n=1 Tax=Gemelliphila palaticanis TaxID=81950 RepID=A0ABX2SYR0_9BACL|nr:hypothetical protein [Gemella palaticanis]MBF0715222.1 hypothetical protein [Gemella palaticanis]NYS47152.1 hypothetical protein [Gemella palaticanis]
MSEEQFWKTVYLYLNKYGYDIIHYRPEKKDVWLINDYNEIYRFVYLDDFNIKEVDSNVYNIIKNEKKLKKSFKLNFLKIKSIYITESTKYSSTDYKKYKVSDGLTIERIILSDNNKYNFIKNSDYAFINVDSGIDKYKKRVVNYYKNKNSIDNNINFRFNLLTVSIIFIFCLNYLFLNFSDKRIVLYDYINFNFYKIISGEFYRLFSDMFVYSDIKSLILSVLVLLLCSILFGDKLKLNVSITIMFIVSIINNLFVILGYFENIEISSLAVFSLLGSIFISELNSKSNNLITIYSLTIPIIYIFLYSIFFEYSIGIYMLSFTLGIFIKIIFIKNVNLIISYSLILTLIVSSFILNIFNIDMKSGINNYLYQISNDKFLKENSNKDRLNYLENKIKSNNKSVISYYELGLLKIKYSSVSEAKNVFLDGISFDQSFAPLYYQLAIIYRAELDEDKARYYIEEALILDKDNKEYLYLKNELNKAS